MEKAQKEMPEFQGLDTNGDFYDTCERIKTIADIRKKHLKYEIDYYSDVLIESIEICQQNCFRLSKEENKMTKDIEKSKNRLHELIQQFEALKINERQLDKTKNKPPALINKFKELRSKISLANKDFQQKLEIYHHSFIGFKEYSFEFVELPIENIFGRIVEQVSF